jgi:hypothetical protein
MLVQTPLPSSVPHFHQIRTLCLACNCLAVVVVHACNFIVSNKSLWVNGHVVAKSHLQGLCRGQWQGRVVGGIPQNPRSDAITVPFARVLVRSAHNEIYAGRHVRSRTPT